MEQYIREKINQKDINIDEIISLAKTSTTINEFYNILTNKYNFQNNQLNLIELAEIIMNHYKPETFDKTFEIQQKGEKKDHSITQDNEANNPNTKPYKSYNQVKPKVKPKVKSHVSDAYRNDYILWDKQQISAGLALQQDQEQEKKYQYIFEETELNNQIDQNKIKNLKYKEHKKQELKLKKKK